MLVEFENVVVNLDNATIFLCFDDEKIRFFFNFVDEDGKDWIYQDFVFKNEKKRDINFSCILNAYESGKKVCFLE